MKTFNKYFSNISSTEHANTILSNLTSYETKIINRELSDHKGEAGEGNFSPIQEYVWHKTSKIGGSRCRRRPSRKYKKSAKRVFRKKSRSTRRR
jgi:hypothetical protein